MTFNTKSTSKINKLKSFFHLKSKLNRGNVLALPDWQLLRQVSENAILHPIFYSYLQNYFMFTSLTKNEEY